ncbi:phage adaptor protein [Nitrospirillum iridis]|uniref:Uncharacterized protein n=1 Tax=Nitrospirillum iridis TaxID=765888 RepID=A0A7X0B1M1_9PROT|nr:hypothetical protein [Nitrospirillum iridis]MBB6253030.1 hypothetical protein [Nitrospirillum iridis]
MNYGDIKGRIKSRVNRKDLSDDLAAQFVDEAMTRIGRVLRIPSMEQLFTVGVSDGFTGIDIPNDFLDLRAVFLDHTELRRVALPEFLRMHPHDTPRVFTRMGPRFLVRGTPRPGVSVYLNYYAAFGALIADSDKNALTEASPDLITYAALSVAADHFVDDRQASWEARYQSILSDIMAQAESLEMSGAVMAVPAAYDANDGYAGY